MGARNRLPLRTHPFRCRTAKLAGAEVDFASGSLTVPRGREMKRWGSILAWVVVSLLCGLAVAVIALHRGESINAMWLVVAALCSYALGYRFYSKFLAARD